MPALERLAAPDLRAVIEGYRDALAAHREVINRLNVYPVPDGDTGTNMSLTLDSVCQELANADSDISSTCKAISHGSLMGARGNSGVILSQVLRGFADVVREGDGCDGKVMATALAAAAQGAYGAVMRPVEGTILTVVREAAEAAEKTAGEGAVLVDVVEAAKRQGADALARTPEMLPVLADAGVVDAGGAGFLLLLDVMLNVIDGRPVPEPDPELAGPSVVVDRRAGLMGGEGGIGDLRYEVMYFLEADDATIPDFKDVWAGIGDSIVVVGGDGIWNCHIHTDDIGAAVEAALDAGRPRNIRVTDLMEEVEEERWVREGVAAGELVAEPAHNEPVETAVVAVATGDGIRRIFFNLHVQRIVTGGQSMNPSTAQLLEAVDSAPATQVIILPNNKNIIPVAEQVQQHTTKSVRVVPTRGIAEGCAAAIAYDPEASVDENAEAMSRAATSVVAGEVTRAVRDAPSDAGAIREGDYIGLARDGIRSVDETLEGAAISLLNALVGDDHEIVMIIEGEGASAATTRRITDWLGDHRPEVNAEVLHGGQPLYPYLFGVE